MNKRGVKKRIITAGNKMDIWSLHFHYHHTGPKHQALSHLGLHRSFLLISTLPFWTPRIHPPYKCQTHHSLLSRTLYVTQILTRLPLPIIQDAQGGCFSETLHDCLCKRACSQSLLHHSFYLPLSLYLALPKVNH